MTASPGRSSRASGRDENGNERRTRKLPPLCRGILRCIVAFAVGFGAFALVSPPLEAWNLITTVAIGLVGVFPLVWSAQYPILATAMAISASALTPIATPAAWIMLYFVGRWRSRRTAIIALVAGVAADTFLLVLFVIRWARPVSLGSAIVIGVFSAIITASITIAGTLIKSHRDREERAIASAVERRTEFTRDIHDHLGHRLALLNLYSASLDHLDTLSATERRVVIDGIQRQVREAVDALTATIKNTTRFNGVRPTQALTAIVEEVRAVGVELDVAIVGNLNSLDTQHAAIFVRYCREGLTNALKYASPGTLILAVTVGVEGVFASLSSPRDIFESQNVRESSKIGLATLHEHAASLGGSSILTYMPHLVTLTLTLPNRSVADGEAH